LRNFSCNSLEKEKEKEKDLDEVPYDILQIGKDTKQLDKKSREILLSILRKEFLEDI